MKDQHSSWDIRLEHLRVGYGSRVVLDDINAVLPGGKITVILGESGCGKSTLLRHVIGLSRPMQGHILYGGQDLFALPERQFRRVRRRFGVLFQDGALLGSLTLAENVGLPLHEHTRLPKATIRSTVLRILDLVGLAEFADYYPNELSDGKPVPVAYRMMLKNGKWVVYDVLIENVSLIKNYRSQFQDVLTRGTPEQLIERVEARARELQAQSTVN